MTNFINQKNSPINMLHFIVDHVLNFLNVSTIFLELTFFHLYFCDVGITIVSPDNEISWYREPPGKSHKQPSLVNCLQEHNNLIDLFYSKVGKERGNTSEKNEIPG